MTIEEKLKTMLIDNGMFEEQAVVVMERVKADKSNEAMATSYENCWRDSVEGYPKQLLTILWGNVRRHALAYIDETMPKAWFRPMFE